MKYLHIVILIIVLLGIISCDDNVVTMDLTPPLPGHLWRVHNGYGKAVLDAYSFRDSWDGFFSRNTPFDDGDAFGVACGDGRVWVSGNIDDYKGDYIWEPDVGQYEAPGGGGLHTTGRIYGLMLVLNLLGLILIPTNGS